MHVEAKNLIRAGSHFSCQYDDGAGGPLHDIEFERVIEDGSAHYTLDSFGGERQDAMLAMYMAVKYGIPKQFECEDNNRDSTTPLHEYENEYSDDVI
jgi:hypothetical protein